MMILDLDDFAMRVEVRIVEENSLGLKGTAAKLFLKQSRAKCEIIGDSDATRQSF